MGFSLRRFLEDNVLTDLINPNTRADQQRRVSQGKSQQYIKSEPAKLPSPKPKQPTATFSAGVTNKPQLNGAFKPTPRPMATQLFPGPYRPEVLSQTDVNIQQQADKIDAERKARIAQLTEELKAKSTTQNILGSINDVFNPNSQLDKIKRLNEGGPETVDGLETQDVLTAPLNIARGNPITSLQKAGDYISNITNDIPVVEQVGDFTSQLLRKPAQVANLLTGQRMNAPFAQIEGSIADPANIDNPIVRQLADYSGMLGQTANFATLPTTAAAGVVSEVGQENYNELIKQGVPESEARLRSLVSGSSQALVELLSTKLQVALGIDKIAAGKFLTGIALESGTEGLEELTQKMINNAATNKPIMSGTGEAFVGGARGGLLLGGTFGAVSKYGGEQPNTVQKQTDQANQKIKDNTRKIIDRLKIKDEGGYIQLPDNKQQKPSKIHPEDQSEMSDFIDYTKGIYKPDNPQQLELDAARIAEKYGLPMPDTTQKLANVFDKELQKQGFKGQPQVSETEGQKLYHGTTSQNAESIRTGGFSLDGQTNKAKGSSNLGRGISLSKDKKVAGLHALGGQDGRAVLEVGIDSNAKIFGIKDVPREYVVEVKQPAGHAGNLTALETLARKQGYDGIDLAELESAGIIKGGRVGAVESEVFIFNPRVLAPQVGKKKGLKKLDNKGSAPAGLFIGDPDGKRGKPKKSKKTKLKFIETAKASPNTSKEVKSKLRSRTTPTRTNKSTIAKAKTDIKRMGFEKAVQQAKNSDTPSTDLQARSLELITQLQAKGRHQDALDVIRQTAARGKTSGQSSQILAAYNRLTPEGILIQAQSYVDQAKKSNPKYKDLKITTKQGEKLFEMAKAVQKMKDGPEKVLAQAAIQDEILKIVPTPNAQKAVTLWKAGLLTGIKGGIFGNLVGNSSMQLLNQVSSVPSATIDTAISKATGIRSKSFTFKGLISGFGKGAKVGYQNLKNRRGAEDLTEKLDYKKTFYSDSKLGKTAQAYTDFVFNFYSAADRPFYYSALENALRERAKVEGKNQGLKGQEYRDFIKETVASPSDEINTLAVNDALTMVFQNQSALGAALQGGKQALTKATESKGSNTGAVVGEVLIPFTGVPSNVAAAVYSYTPIPAVKNTLSLIKKSNRQNFDQDKQRQLSESLGKGITGTGMMWMGAQLLSSGLLTLGYPDDPDERALWEAEGKQPYSLKIGGKWRSLNYSGPNLVLLSIGGRFAQTMQNGGSTGTATLTSLLSIPKTVLESSPLSGLDSALEAIKGLEGEDGSVGYAANKYGLNLVSSILPTISNDVAKVLDPYNRQVNTIPDAIKSRVPWARNTLDKRIGTFGQPTERKTDKIETLIDPFKSSKATTNELTSELRRLFDGDKSRKITPSQITAQGWGLDNMSKKQKDSILQVVGPEIEERWNEVIKQKSYQALSDDDKVDRLQKEQKNIMDTRKDEFKALSNDEDKQKWITNGIMNYLNSNAVNEDGFIDIVVRNAQAFTNDPLKAISYINKENILRSDNGATIIKRLPSSESEAIRKEKGATEENAKSVKLDHTIPLQLGGDNSRENLKLVSTEEHKSYNPMENEVARRLRTGQISGPQAKKDILALKNGDITLDEYRGPAPGKVENITYKASKSKDSSSESTKSTSKTSGDSTRESYYEDKYNDTVAKLNDSEDLSDVEKFKLKDEIKTLKVRKNYSRDVVDLYNMSKADAYSFLKKHPNGESLAKKLVAYGDAMVKAGLWDYSKYRDKNGVVSIAPKGSSSTSSGSKSSKAKFDYKLFLKGTPNTTNKTLQGILERTLA